MYWSFKLIILGFLRWVGIVWLLTVTFGELLKLRLFDTDSEKSQPWDWNRKSAGSVFVLKALKWNCLRNCEVTKADTKQTVQKWCGYGCCVKCTGHWVGCGRTLLTTTKCLLFETEYQCNKSLQYNLLLTKLLFCNHKLDYPNTSVLL